MRIIRILFASIFMLFTVTGLAAPKTKSLICHVGNEVGPGGEVYLDDPSCVPSDANGFFCPDAGKVDLIVVGKKARHLDNPSHSFGGLSDYEPGEVGASGEGTEDSNGDGIDDGCEPSLTCPCWDKEDLVSVTADNHAGFFSCAGKSNYPESALIQNEFGSTPDVEGGFLAAHGSYPSPKCITRDYPPNYLPITAEEAAACIELIAARCASIGDPITGG